MHVEELLHREDRCVLPLGCTEQHAFLSLSTDSILAEKMAIEAAEPLDVPVFPVLAYGLTPTFRAYPGSVTIRFTTYVKLVVELVESLAGQGFRRILVVNGHGGNIPARNAVYEWLADGRDVRVQWHDWWMAPKTIAKVREIDPIASHASWMENFPWTRLPGVAIPEHEKPMVDLDRLRQVGADECREMLGDGNFGGRYQRSDAEMAAIWEVAIEETRSLLESGWA